MINLAKLSHLSKFLQITSMTSRNGYLNERYTPLKENEWNSKYKF